jgi:hypothetical protein
MVDLQRRKEQAGGDPPARRPVLWDSEATFSQIMKEKLKAQETKPNSNCTQKKANALLFNSEFLKSRSLYERRSVSFYRGGELSFYIPRIPLCRTNQNIMC